MIKKNFKRNAFKLYITINSKPFELKNVEEKYNINLVIELPKHEFVCLFGETWNCNNKYPYTWVYNEEKLFCSS